SVFLVTVLFIFGGATLKDFALAMMVGLASGTYSSIFIASPVLTAWKEREPAYRRRRERIAEQMGGQVPAFPEENTIARLEDGPEDLPPAEPEPEPAAVGPGPGNDPAGPTAGSVGTGPTGPPPAPGPVVTPEP